MTNPRKKLDVLKGSLESGIIGREEYEKKASELEPDIREFDKKVEEINKKDFQEEPKKPSEKILIVSISAIILILISIFAYSYFNRQQPKTLEEMHILNLKGKLKPAQGYVYKGVYSFVTLDNLWYTQLTSPKGAKLYSLALRYSPKDVEGIGIEGSLGKEFFDSKSDFYVTFNPIGNDFAHVALAVADFNTHMSKVFEKNPIAACDRNETEPCKARPIVTCADFDKLVLYIKESDRFRAYYNNNCIVIEGNGLDLVKGVDRILYNFYNIMDQEEA